MEKSKSRHLAAGDFVVVRSVEEITDSLDARGTLDGLVFMPEMKAYCGRRFRVSRRAQQVCTDGAPVPEGESSVRGFHGDDVVLLDGLRCSGVEYGACRRGCTIFWKESWLRKVEENTAVSSPPERDSPGLVLPTPRNQTGACYCQSSELIKATYHLHLLGRVRNVSLNIIQGNYGLFEMLRTLVVWCYWKLRQRLFGPYPSGTRKPTPDEASNLQPGDWVEVKCLDEIVATLDKNGKNRGLHFSPDMVPYCGKRLKVWCRADNLVAEGIGVVRHLKNTVILEGVVCDSAVYAFGGCPREDLLYWREIWLRRSP